MRSKYPLTKTIVIISALGSILSGCACLEDSYSKTEQAQSIIAKRCAEADVLVTDLTVAPPERSYVLASGEVCPILKRQ